MRRVMLAGALLALCGLSTAEPSVASVASAPRTVTEAAQHQLIPAYFYPTGNTPSNPWHIMCRAMNATAGGSIVIQDPNVGPGTRRLSVFVEALAYCHAKGQKVIGYISTDYATRSLAQVLHEVDLYYRWYRVDGIFLDEMSNFPTTRVGGGLTIASYYQRIYQKVKHVRDARGRLLVGNPGAPAATAWQLTRPVADKVVVFEDTAAVYQQRTPPAWVLHRPSTQIGALVKNTSSSTRHRICTLSRARNAGFVDVTDDGPPNTWDTLPSYWSQVAPHCT